MMLPLNGLYSRVLELVGFRRISGHLIQYNRISTPWNLLDCGSNQGVFLSRVLATLPQPNSITCVEANPTLANTLQTSISYPLNIINAAISDENSGKEIEFTVSSNSEASSTYPKIAAIYGNEAKILIPTVTLTTLLENFPSNEQLIVKMDIEGAELNVLENLSLADLRRISQLTVEFHDNLDPSMRPRVQRIIEQMKRSGFIAIKGDPPGHTDVLLIAQNEMTGVSQKVRLTIVSLLILLKSILKMSFFR